MASFVALFVIAAVTAAPVYGKDYVVGDSQGWTSGVDYDTWAKGNAFTVGDTLSKSFSLLVKNIEICLI
jgi:Plastocyanin-like domain